MELIRQIGASGATGYAIEFTGPAISALSVEARMTICNMAVKAGARGTFMAPDEKVFAYLADKPRAPKGPQWDQAVNNWKSLSTDPGATFDLEVQMNVADLQPMVTWGTSPDQAAAISERVPDPMEQPDLIFRRDLERALRYMDLQPGTALSSIKISHAFIGSCTNARIEDLHDAARVVKGRKVAEGVLAMIVPGSTLVRDHAESEGLAQIFRDAGFEWRQSGCPMCLAMNDDVLSHGDAQHILLSDGRCIKFNIDVLRKDALLQGLDAIGSTLVRSEQIRSFEEKHLQANPWLA